MFSGDGREGSALPDLQIRGHQFFDIGLRDSLVTNSTKHNPWDAKLWDTPQNVRLVDLR